MEGRRFPLWAEVVAGLVTWAMAAAAIVLWILPPGGSAAEGTATGQGEAKNASPGASGKAKAASPSPSAETYSASRVAPYAKAPQVAWKLNAESNVGGGAHYTSVDEVVDGSAAPIDAGQAWVQGATTSQSSDDVADSERVIEGIAPASGQVPWALTARDGIYSCATHLQDGLLPCFERLGTSRAEGNNIALIDPANGDRKRTIELKEVGTAMSRVEPVEGGFVIAGRDNWGGGLMATRLRQDGTVVWSQRVQIPEGTRDATEDFGSRSLDITDDLVVVSLTFFTQVLDLADGTPVKAPEVLGRVNPDGAVLFQHMEPDSGTSTNAVIMLANAPHRLVDTGPTTEEGPNNMFADGVVAVQVSATASDAYDSRTGSKLWRADLNGLSARVTTDTAWIASDWSEGRIAAIEIKTGKILWERKLQPQTRVSWGVEDGEHAIVAIGSKLTALNLSDGATAWELPLDIAPAEDSYPMVYGVAGRIIVEAGADMIAMREAT